MQRSEMGYRRGGTGGGRLSTRLWAGVSPGDVGGDAGRFGATCDDDSHVRIGDMRWRDIVACDRAAFFGEVAVRSFTDLDTTPHDGHVAAPASAVTTCTIRVPSAKRSTRSTRTRSCAAFLSAAG